MTQEEIRKSLEASAKESYTPKTDEEIQKQAEGMYKQQFENDLKNLRDQTEQNILKAQRDSIASGMQRSSYVAAQQGLVRNAGLESQRQLQSNYETNLANAIADLRDKDNDRKLADDQYRNQLLLQLYNMGGSSGGGGKPKNDKNNSSFDSLLPALKAGATQGVDSYFGLNYDLLLDNSIVNYLNSDKYRTEHGLQTIDKNGKKRNLVSAAGDLSKLNAIPGSKRNS